MPNFSELFDKTDQRIIEYQGKMICRIDQFLVKNGEKIRIFIESTNSEYRQGVSVDITGKCEFKGKLFERGKGVDMIFWEDSSPEPFELTIYTKKDFVWIQNIWERYSLTGAPYEEHGQRGAAMIVEEIENGRRYRCNDGHPDENFDDIVFTVRRIS